MGHASYTPESHDFRWYDTDDSTPLANENATATGISATQEVVLHYTILETGGDSSLPNAALTLEYSETQVTWLTVGAPASTTQSFRWVDNSGLTHATATSVKLSGGVAEKVYEMESTGDFDGVAASNDEVALSIGSYGASAGTYYFRVSIGGSAVTTKQDPPNVFPNLTIAAGAATYTYDRNSDINFWDISQYDRNSDINFYDVFQYDRTSDIEFYYLATNTYDRNSDIHFWDVNIYDRDSDIHFWDVFQYDRDSDIHFWNIEQYDRTSDIEFYYLATNTYDRNSNIHFWNMVQYNLNSDIHFHQINNYDRTSDIEFYYLATNTYDRSSDIHFYDIIQYNRNSDVHFWDTITYDRTSDIEFYEVNTNTYDRDSDISFYDIFTYDRTSDIEFYDLVTYTYDRSSDINFYEINIYDRNSDVHYWNTVTYDRTSDIVFYDENAITYDRSSDIHFWGVVTYDIDSDINFYDIFTYDRTSDINFYDYFQYDRTSDVHYWNIKQFNRNSDITFYQINNYDRISDIHYWDIKQYNLTSDIEFNSYVTGTYNRNSDIHFWNVNQLDMTSNVEFYIPYIAHHFITPDVEKIYMKRESVYRNNDEKLTVTGMFQINQLVSSYRIPETSPTKHEVRTIGEDRYPTMVFDGGGISRKKNQERINTGLSAGVLLYYAMGKCDTIGTTYLTTTASLCLNSTTITVITDVTSDVSGGQIQAKSSGNFYTIASSTTNTLMLDTTCVEADGTTFDITIAPFLHTITAQQNYQPPSFGIHIEKAVTHNVTRKDLLGCCIDEAKIRVTALGRMVRATFTITAAKVIDGDELTVTKKITDGNWYSFDNLSTVTGDCLMTYNDSNVSDYTVTESLLRSMSGFELNILNNNRREYVIGDRHPKFTFSGGIGVIYSMNFLPRKTTLRELKNVEYQDYEGDLDLNIKFQKSSDKYINFDFDKLYLLSYPDTNPDWKAKLERVQAVFGIAHDGELITKVKDNKNKMYYEGVE